MDIHEQQPPRSAGRGTSQGAKTHRRDRADRRATMSVKIMSLVWQCPDLQNQCRLLLMLAIADHCNDDGNCYPSKASLMAKARMKERTFVNAKHWLIDHGFLQIDYCEGATTGAGKTNLYQINLKRLQWSASSAAPWSARFAAPLPSMVCNICSPEPSVKRIIKENRQ
jgi:hypothetical protein